MRDLAHRVRAFGKTFADELLDLASRHDPTEGIAEDREVLRTKVAQLESRLSVALERVRELNDSNQRLRSEVAALKGER